MDRKVIRNNVIVNSHVDLKKICVRPIKLNDATNFTGVESPINYLKSHPVTYVLDC